ncbi:MAG: alpha/beta hydrolase [Hyphomicrobiaceae bacterium]
MLPELFPGFESRRIETDGASIHVRVGGRGPAVVCLHGYPQTHACWHKVAGALAERFTVVLPDLRGYGDSTGPKSCDKHLAYSKRAMAADVVAVMRALGHERFQVVGHDRGARVGYRLVLDHPDRVERFVSLDVVPTYDAWADISRENAIGRFHWSFLARPAPFPETMIGRDPVFFMEYLFAQWCGTRDLSPFAEGAMAHYRMSYSKPEVIHACCEDYRAGAGIDVELDAADLEVGRKIACPTLVLWGGSRAHGVVHKPIETWRRWCTNVIGEPVECGHFLPEEAPAETLARLLPFLSGKA